MRKPTWWESIGIIIAILSCLAAYLALPQVQSILIGQSAAATITATPTVVITVASPRYTLTSAPTIISPSPTIVPKPPKGKLQYYVSRLTTVWGLMHSFLFMDQSSSMSTGGTFCKSHPELTSRITVCDSASSVVIGTLEMRWDELNPVTFTEVQKKPDTLVWLSLMVNDDIVRIKGLGVLYELRGQWVLVRGMWQTDGFKIDPRDFIFVWSDDRWQYEQLQ